MSPLQDILLDIVFKAQELLLRYGSVQALGIPRITRNAVKKSTCTGMCHQDHQGKSEL